MRIVETKDVTEIRPLYDAWLLIANGDEFGLDIDIKFAESNMQKMLSADGSLLVAYDDGGEPVAVSYTHLTLPTNREV